MLVKTTACQMCREFFKTQFTAYIATGGHPSIRNGTDLWQAAEADQAVTVWRTTSM